MKKQIHSLSLGAKRVSIYISLCLLSIVILGVMLVHAQEFRGLIIGQVTDPNGAVVPNAAVTALREGETQPYTAQTNSKGDFSIPYVQPGFYTITVEAPGFKKAVRQGVKVDVSQKINLNFTLEIGSITEQVTVTGDALQVNTGDASGGTTIDADKVQNLPLNGRQIYMLLPLTPGVRFTQTTFGPGGFSGTRAWDETNAYVINGVQGSYNQFTLNGAPITQQSSTLRGSWQIAPSVDAVQEFKIMTNTYDAQYGRAGGGTINTILKSGTKEFHGTIFDFWRNSILDANTYQLNLQGIKRQPHNEHQFGGTIGGPIPGFNKKSFFFFSFEGWREILPQGIITTTPSANVRPRADGSVDFRPFFTQLFASRLCNGVPCYNPNGPSPQGGIYDPLLTDLSGNRVRFQYNGQLDVLPPNRVSAIGRRILDLFPLPNNPGAGEFNNFTATSPGRYTYNMPIIRIDHHFSDKTRFYGMYTWWAGDEFRNLNGFDGPAMRGNINHRSNGTVVLDLTHTITPNLFGDLRVSFNRSWKTTADGNISGGFAELSASDLGLSMPVDRGQITTVTRRWAPTISVAGYPQIIGNQTNQSIDSLMYETYEASPSFSHTIGRHNLHYGGQIMIMHAIPGFLLGNPNGAFNFNGGFTQQNPNVNNNSGLGLASLLLGYPAGGNVDFRFDVYESYPYFALYLQDDFKLRPNLTINMGLRWDVEGSPKERYHRLNAGFDYDVTNPITSRITFPTLPNGLQMVNPIRGGFRFSSDDLAPYDTHKKQFQPRFGISWAINDKTVLRGGWGMYSTFAIELGGNTTWTQPTNYAASLDGNRTPTDFFRSGIPYPDGVNFPVGNTLGLLSGLGIGQSFDQRDRRIPSVQQYSFGIQRELPGGIVLDASYIGSRTKDLRVGRHMSHLPTELVDRCRRIVDEQRLINPTNITCSLLEQFVPNPFFGVLPTSTDLGRLQNVRVKMLLTQFPQFFNFLFSNTEPVGTSNYNSLAVKLEKRLRGGGLLTRGLSFLTSFTWSKTMAANGFLNNSAPNNGGLGGGRVDTETFSAVTGTDRTLDFAFSGLWGLPIGKGGVIFRNAKGAFGQLVNDWSIDWIFTHNSGTPIGLPNGFIFNCPNHPSYLPDPGKRSYAQWLYNENPTCFTPIGNVNPYAPITQIPRVSYIRAPWRPQLTLALAKQFTLREGWKLQFKAEAFNATNTPIFGGPSTGAPNQPVTRNPLIKEGDPGSCSGYGCVGATQQNFPRHIQLSLKLNF